MLSLGLAGSNKSFLCATVRAPGSTHDARIFKSTRLYQSILNGETSPEKSMTLEGSCNILLATIGDIAFPRHSRPLKRYNKNSTDQQPHYFEKKLCSARVVTENAYGMLKGRWRILYKKTENLKLFVEHVETLHTFQLLLVLYYTHFHMQVLPIM